MSAENLIPVLLLLIVIPGHVLGQEAPIDTALVKQTNLRHEPSALSNTLVTLSRGDTVLILDREDDYVKVRVSNTLDGWVSERGLMSEGKAREHSDYLRSLRRKGYTMILKRQSFKRNRADGISVGLGIENISQSKTIKYLTVTWRLFNSVGDASAGEHSGKSNAQTRLVGPIDPGKSAYTEFENVWYNPVGTCAEIRKIEVVHVDGSSFTYVNDLRDIVRQSESVRLEGDCSLEGQQ